MEFFIGPALSCRNTKDLDLNSKVMPRGFVYYVDNQRRALSVPWYFIELQPEQDWVSYDGKDFVSVNNDWWSILKDDRISKEMYRQQRIIGVHSPTINIDVLTEDKYLKRKSILSIMKAMEYANAINANYFVLHLCQKDKWDSINIRNQLIDESIKVFARLAQFYKSKGFQFKMCIENLEYPKFPSTPYECGAILSACENFMPVKFVLDVPHLWRSRSLICEKYYNMRGVFENIWSKSFGQMLADTLDILNGKILLFHMAGCWQTLTHEIPGIRPHEDPFSHIHRINAPDWVYDEYNELNISHALDCIIKYCKYNKIDLAIILEIFNRPFSHVIKSIKHMNWGIGEKIHNSAF